MKRKKDFEVDANGSPSSMNIDVTHRRRGGKTRILIVEDGLAMVAGLRDNFEYEGYEVISAADGVAGLDVPGDDPDLGRARRNDAADERSRCLQATEEQTASHYDHHADGARDRRSTRLSAWSWERMTMSANRSRFAN